MLVDSSTNTIQTETKEIGVQANPVDIIFEVFDIECIIDTVFAQVVDLVEDDTVQALVDAILPQVIIVVPDSPLRDVKVDRCDSSLLFYIFVPC